MWGSQSWLQPAFSRLSSLTTAPQCREAQHSRGSPPNTTSRFLVEKPQVGCAHGLPMKRVPAPDIDLETPLETSFPWPATRDQPASTICPR